MASYTIEDIELIRRKSGISYQEAVSLLDYHNGNVARALVDLERNGRLKPDAAAQDEAKSAEKTASSASSTSSHKSKGGFMHFINKLYRARVKVARQSIPILNISLLFTLVAALISPHLLILSAILILLLGYRVSLEKDDPDFAGEKMDRMVKNAASNVRSTVDEFTRGFQAGMNSKSESTEKKAEVDSADERSYYAANATKPEYHSCPTINVPVQVPSQDGNVTVEDDTDGFNSATIK